MRNCKAKDENGIIAEMLKDGSRNLREATLEIFNDVMMMNAGAPSAWKKTKLVVIFKKGSPKLPENYRPIAILPIMYKLFSRMLCIRIQPDISKAQSADQAAYRPGYSTDDH